jgi:Transposase IS116/IS110/IS902 family
MAASSLASAQFSFEPVKRLSRDLASAAGSISFAEARYLVDAYYMMQENRIRSNAQMRQLREGEEPHDVIQYLAEQDGVLEGQIRRSLDKWTGSQPMGQWAKSIIGIGPVIAAGLLAHIDITKCPTAGHIWRFAGLDPTLEWKKGQKRPFNASLKTLCAFKLGESFVKVQNHKRDVYGKLYAQRKHIEQANNDAGLFSDQAAKILETRKIGKETEAYKAYSIGRLPPAQIHARARRYAVKMFLSHYHAEAYRQHFGCEPPKPFAIAILGHAHLI